MILSTTLDCGSDNIDFEIQYSETGSSLTVFDKDSKRKIVTLSCLPPRKLKLLQDRLIDEIAKGIIVDPITKKRKP